MFENIDNPPKSKDEHENLQSDKDINLLPDDFKHSKKPKAQPKFRLTQEDLHPASQKSNTPEFDSSKSKPRKFSLTKIFSRFKKSKKKKTSQPSILSMNLTKHKPPAPPAPDKKIDSPASAKLDPHKPIAQAHHQPAPSHNLPPTSQPPVKPVQPGEVVFSQIKGEPNDHKKEEELDVNLLPKRQRKLSDKQMIISYVMIFVIGLLAVISPYIFYRTNNDRYQAENIMLEEQIELITQTSQGIQSQIKELGPLSNKLKQLLTLFNQHVYWSEFFPSLERHTAKNVYFTSLDVGLDNHISLQGKALTLRDIAEQLIIFQTSQDYLNVQLQGLSLVEIDEPGEPQIEFTLDFNLDPSIILIYNSQDSS